VWRFFPGLWQRGGEIISEDNARRSTPSGSRQLTLWQQMAVVDESVFFDPNDAKAEPLFTGGHLGMFVTGPGKFRSSRSPV
jgi:multiple sugar transport system substrate-binding protein